MQAKRLTLRSQACLSERIAQQDDVLPNANRNALWVICQITKPECSMGRFSIFQTDFCRVCILDFHLLTTSFSVRNLKIGA